MKLNLFGILMAISMPLRAFGVAENVHITPLVFEFDASDLNLKTGYVLYPGDIVFVSAQGKATFGPLARYALGALNAAGSGDANYRVKWNKEIYPESKFGAVMCRIGTDDNVYKPILGNFKDCLSDNFDIGTCPVSENPIPGALVKVEQTGELWFDINDKWRFDNDGSYTLTVVVFSSHLPPYDYRQYNIADDTFCKIAMSTNLNGGAYNANNMERIALSGKTELLRSFDDINSFYRFLNENQAVRRSGIRWQQVAIEVTGMMLLTNRLLEELRKPSFQPQISSAKFVMLGTYMLLTSRTGKNFLEGIASKGLVNDVTRRFYLPLLRGEVEVKDPLYFDLGAVYAEQYNPDLKKYYADFNFFDQILIEGLAARTFAGKAGCMNPTGGASLDQQINIVNPRDRVKIGLFKMGYSSGQINQAMARLDALIGQNLGHERIIESLSQQAFSKRQ